MAKSLQKQIDELKKKVDLSLKQSCGTCSKGVDVPDFPQEGDEHWTIDGEGSTFIGTWVDSGSDKARLNLGNCFKTKEEAEMYALRIESLSKGFIPKEGGAFWVWDFEEGEPRVVKGYYKSWAMDVKHRTEQECQAWYDKYGTSWEYLYK